MNNMKGFCVNALFCGSLAVATICHPQSQIDLAFSNGVWTHQAEANQHGVRLQDDLRTVGGIKNIRDEVILLYHVNSYKGNLEEVLIQKVIEAHGNPNDTLRWATAYFSILSGTATLDSPEVELVGTANSPTDELFRQMSAATRIKHQVGVDIKKLLRALRQNDTVLLVSHSQGNLYSNASVLGVRQQLSSSEKRLTSHLRVVGVGVPSPYLVSPDGSPNYTNYVTNTGDRVIYDLRRLVNKMNGGGRAPFCNRSTRILPSPT